VRPACKGARPVSPASSKISRPFPRLLGARPAPGRVRLVGAPRTPSMAPLGHLRRARAHAPRRCASGRPTHFCRGFQMRRNQGAPRSSEAPRLRRHLRASLSNPARFSRIRLQLRHHRCLPQPRISRRLSRVHVPPRTSGFQAVALQGSWVHAVPEDCEYYTVHYIYNPILNILQPFTQPIIMAARDIREVNGIEGSRFSLC